MAGLEKGRAAHVVVETATTGPGETVITIAGELDVSNAAQLKSTLAGLADREQLIFDLGGLRYMDSAGISVLLEAAGMVPSVCLRNPSTSVRRVIELTGLTDVLPTES